MIEHQLSSMPSGQSGQHCGKYGQQQPMWQDRVRHVEAQTEIGSGNGNKRHGGNGMVPAGNADADAWNGQQFECTNDGGEHPEGEGKARGPETNTYPKRIGAEPIEHIDAKRADNERNGKMHQHGVYGMTSDRDCGADVLVGDGANGWIGVATIGFWRRFLLLDFLLFSVRLRHPGPRFVKFAALAATPLVLSGCNTPLSTLDPAGPAAANIALLWWVMFWGSVVLFTLVLGLLAVSFWRPALIASVKPMHWIIGGGLIMPIPILIALVIAALALGEQLLPRSDGMAPLRIEAQASQWQWTFRYPDSGGAADSDVLHIPAGQPVDIVISSLDVIHGFWIPRLGGKMDAIPGHTNIIRLQANEPGIYRGICAEYCGEGHETMSFVVEAHAIENYAAALGEVP